MYFLSAQPDELFFKWQLEVQLFNFHKLNIPAEKIHVLISYNPERGINPIFLDLEKEQSHRACFFFYEDVRAKRNYVPSARPHIIKKHFSACPQLKEECIFYHDSDIIFRELPDFGRLCKGDTWYVSDTHNYISASYICDISEIILHEMCELLGVKKEIILENDHNAGGAQYLLKGVNYQFWDKIEHDAEKLYTYLSNNKERYAAMFSRNTGKDISQFNEIQAWCADMWAILWNGYQLGYDIKIDKELDFCWPLEPIDKWSQTKLLHNSGVTGRQPGMFYKGEHYQSVPYDTSFDHVAKDKCTYKYVEAIQEYMNSLRIDLSDVTFLLSCRIDSGDRLENIYITTAYLNKYFKTKIILLEADVESQVESSRLPTCVQKIFIPDENIYLHRTRYHNMMIKMADTKIIAIYDVDVVFAPSQIKDAVMLIRSGQSEVVYPYNGSFLSVEDHELKKCFSSNFDTKLFNKCTAGFSYKSLGGAVFINKEVYIKCGLDNEAFLKWGPEDMERAKRLEILGYKYARIDGPLYHLFHKRAHNSTYTSNEDHKALMQEYLRISRMTREELTKDISGWEWTHQC